MRKETEQWGVHYWQTEALGKRVLWRLQISIPYTYLIIQSARRTYYTLVHSLDLLDTLISLLNLFVFLPLSGAQQREQVSLASTDNAICIFFENG